MAPSAVLNWREIAAHVQALAPKVEGMFVDRLVVPARPRFSAGFLKAEWALRLTGRGGEKTLVFSVRPRVPYLFLAPGRGPHASERGTRSPFDLAVNKRLKGARLVSLRAVPRDRTVLVEFTSGEETLILALFLIPATPEAVFGGLAAPGADGVEIEIQAATRKTRAGTARLAVPAAGGAPESTTLSPGFDPDPEKVRAAVEAALDAEALAQRLQELQKHLREASKDATKRADQAAQAAASARGEPAWGDFGALLTAHLHSNPKVTRPEKGAPYVELPGFESGEPTRIPLDPKLTTLADQAKHLYDLDRRKRRREESSAERENEWRAKAAEVATLLDRAAGADWKQIEDLERRSGLAAARTLEAAPSGAGPGSTGPLRNRKPWPGRTYVSKDGFSIWAGRSVEENQELTFKFGRGADIWMHLRGRPGAHLLIPLPAGKTAPLDTLLDAAQLAIHLSGGQNWGKTEVDYTPVKNVKRIKGSTEVQYTGNKTLAVTPDPERLKRLLT